MTEILRARPDQAEALRQIARESKQHWGYGPDYMQAWNHDQTLTADFIARNPVYCAMLDTAVAGFYALDLEADPCDLKHLWVKPGYIGQGVGQRLFNHLKNFLGNARIPICHILAEPHAEGFYQHMGAVKIDQRFLPHLGQVLPLMQLSVPSPARDRSFSLRQNFTSGLG